MATGSGLEGLAGVSAPDAPFGADANDKKRPGSDLLEGDVERRVRPKVNVPPDAAGQEEAEPEEGSQGDLDNRLRALVEVASQRKGDSPLPKAAGNHFKVVQAAAAAGHIPAQAALEALGRPLFSSGAESDAALIEASMADSFLESVPDASHGFDAPMSPPVEPEGAPEHNEPPPEETEAPSLSPQEDVPISQLKQRPERPPEEEEEEGGEEQMQMEGGGEESVEEHHGFGASHGFGVHPQQMHPGYVGYGAHPQYAGHQQYAASAEAQQLAEHAGFGGGHMEQDEDPEHLQSLDLVEVGFPRSSVAELQSLPPDDLITRVLDLEERISAVVREKQLEAAARQEAEDNAARYAEESRHLRQVVREKNGYKKGVLQEIAALEGPVPQSAGRFTITREGSPGGGLRLERGNKGKGKHNSPVKEKWKAEWKRAASQSHYVPSAAMMGGEEYMDPYGVAEASRQPAGVKGFRSRKSGPAQATPASKLLAILGAEPDAGPQDDDDEDDDEEEEDRSDEEYVAPPEPAPRLLGPAGPSPARTSRAESTVGLEDLSEFLRTCCKPQVTGHMTLHRVLWYTYLAWRQKINSQRPSVSSGGVGLSQCMQRLGHRERLFTREIQAKKAGCKGYEGGGKYWMGLIVLDKALVKTGRQWLAKAKRTGSSNRVTFSRDAAIKVQASKNEPEEEEEDDAEAAEA